MSNDRQCMDCHRMHAALALLVDVMSCGGAGTTAISLAKNLVHAINNCDLMAQMTHLFNRRTALIR